ncbi:PE domain-containing protein [Pseudonocardia lacus]|uniref:PE domain-containing protein n=1 Tax=Pseudonocardia lacus TaxID=2835865 RepID=UPI001BDDAA1F|nr:PE domain-containing protein [Pseudonocardia lacus]
MADSTTDLRVDPEQLTRLILRYEDAASRVQRILADVNKRGRIAQAWTADQVSVEMAAHYNAQIFDGDYCTYASIARYESEMRSLVQTLRGILNDYGEVEAESEASIVAAGRPRMDW